MNNPLSKPLPKKYAWATRLVVYSIILLAVGGITYSYSLFKIGTYSQACAANTQGQAGVLGRHKEVMTCLYEKANFIERWLLRPDQKILAALPSSPCRYVGTWAAERSNLTSSIKLTRDGRYTGRVVSGAGVGQSLSGAWGVHGNKMVWLDDALMAWPLDVNKIIDEGAKGFTLIERNGSHTRYVLSELPSSGECASAMARESEITEDIGNKLSASSSVTTPAIVAESDETDMLGDTQSEASPTDNPLLADPLPLSLQETLFLYENISYAEKVNWVNGSIEKIDLPFITQIPARDKFKKLRRYSLAVNKAGLWFAGPVLALREPDGNILTTDFDYHESHITALNDGSLLVFARIRTERTFEIFRARLTNKQLTLTTLDSAPELHSGFATVTLNNGRVLIAGGQYTANEARIFNPKDNSWQATGNMHVRRSNMAIAALPDGRAVVFSSGSRAYWGEDNDTLVKQIYGVEIWDPVTNSWSLLPSLPLSFQIKAHHAIKPSAAVLPDGSLVVGGGMHRHVLLLRHKNGVFAPYWTVAGSLPGRRVNGIVQALSSQEVVVSGGVARLRNNGGCCKYLVSGNRINWTGDGSSSSSSISLTRRNAAIAHRAGLTFAAGGWEVFSLGSETTQASSLAELIDHETGQVAMLPPLPKPLLAGQAIWLDSNRVLVKSVKQQRTGSSIRSENIFDSPYGLELEHGSDGYSAIYNMQKRTWSMFEDSRIEYARPAGMIDKELLLIGPDVKTWALNPDTNRLRELPQRVLSRQSGVARMAEGGKIIVAGGQAQTRVIEAFDADCKKTDCPKRNFGQGGLGPSHRYEILEPGSKHWRLSAPSETFGESIVIRRDGRVIKLGSNANKWIIETSNSKASSWAQLPWPDGLDQSMTSNEEKCGYIDTRRKCALLNGQLGKTDVIVFVQTQWDSETGQFLFNLWLLDQDESQWLPIVAGLNEAQLYEARTLPVQVGGKSLKASNFMPHSFRVWQE